MSLALKVKALDEKTFDISSNGDAIADFRAAVSDTTGVPVGDVKLTYEGKIMKDGKKFADYGLTANSEVQLLSKIPEKSKEEAPGKEQATDGIQLPQEVKDFFESVLDGLVGDARKPDGSRDVGKIKEALLPDVMTMMGGNWQPLAKTIKTVREHILKKTNNEKTPEARQKLVEEIVASGGKFAQENQNSAIAPLFLSKVKPERKEELTQLCVTQSKKQLAKIIDLYLDTDEADFGKSVRPVVVLGLGEFVKLASPCLNGGLADVKTIVGEVSTRSVSMITKYAPDVEPMLKAFVLPMTQSFAENCLREFQDQAD